MNKTDEINVEKKKFQNKKILLILVAVVLLIGITYAYFRVIKYTEEITGKIGGFDITYESSSEIRLENAYPIRDYEVEDEAYENKFKISNNGKKDIYVKLAISDITLSEVFQKNTSDLKWGLYEGTTKITTGGFEKYKDGDIIILPEVTLKATNGEKNYTLRVWINETYENQNNYQTESLSGKITAIVQGKSGNYLANKISEANKNNSNNPTFTNTSTNKGLFVLKDDVRQTSFGFPVYYFRGPVTNNYVQFGTYKEKITNTVYESSTSEGEEPPTVTSKEEDVAQINSPIIWRVIRINEDKSITMIAENDIGKSIAWKSETGTKYSESNIKTVLDKWYTSTFTETYLDSKVISTNFCNDNSYNSTSAASRINKTPPVPTLECDKEDIVNAKVGLISADEMVYAGALYNTALTNTSYITYLDNKTNFWTMTPSDSSNLFTWKTENVYMNNAASNIATDAAARPVITIKPDVTVTSGDGNKDTPYVLSAE